MKQGKNNGSAPSAPKKPTATVTSTTDAKDIWTNIIPTYLGDETTKYYYFTCVETEWANNTPTYEWTTPVIDYGLSTVLQYATEASLMALDTATRTTPITAYGLVGKDEDKASQTIDGVTYDSEGYPKWGNTSYGLILGNSQSLPMLIGGNDGVTIVDTNGANSSGSSIVLAGGGIGMYGSTINFNTSDGTTTNAVSINHEGIIMGTSGNITLLSNNVILNSLATGSNSIFELKKKASDWTEQNDKYDTALKYSISGGLEVTGKVTADTGQIGPWKIASEYIADGTTLTASHVGMRYAGNGEGSKVAFFAGADGTTGISSSQFKVYNNGNVTISGDTSITGKTTIGNSNAKFVFDPAGSGSLTIAALEIKINGKKGWSRDDIIIMKKVGATGYKDQATIESEMKADNRTDWVLIKPYYDAKVSYLGDIEGGDSRGTTTLESDKTFILNLTYPGGGVLSTFGTATWYLYDFSGMFYTTDTNGAAKDVLFTITLVASSVSDTKTISFSTEITNIPLDANRAAISISASSGHVLTNLCGEGYTLKAMIKDTSTGYRGMFVHNSATITCICDATTSRVPCTVYYYP